MSGTEPLLSAPAGVNDALADVGATAREQLAAAWQLHVDRVQEQLQKGWSEHIERIVEERFGELLDRARQEVERQVAERMAKARFELSERLNQSLRRLARSESVAEWSTALLDATRDFAPRASLFSISGEQLRCEAVRVPEGHPAASLTGRQIALAAAPAFAGVADGKDTLVAIRSFGELGESLGTAFAAQGAGKAYLFPLLSRQRVVAILYAEADDQAADVNGLELLASLAAHALETAVKQRGAPGLVAIAGAEPGARPAAAAAVLSKEEQDLHSRAQRFARVQVAEMRLYKSGAVKAGRAEARLYDSLRQDIDSGREAFYSQFVSSCPSMVDYFHLELVRTLANEDASLLGADYPGPLV